MKMNIHDKSNNNGNTNGNNINNTSIENILDKDYNTATTIATTTTNNKRESKDMHNTPKILTNISFNNLNKIPSNGETNISPRADSVDKSINNGIINNNNNLKNLNSKSQPHEEEEIRGTLKKVPKVSKKLPSAFGNIFQKSSASSITNSKNIIQQKMSNNLDQLPSLELLIGAHEYKQVTSLLSPLQVVRDNKQTINPEEVNNGPKKKNEKKRHKNPLIPLKNYLMLSKMNEELKEKSDISIEKLEKLSKLQKENHGIKFIQPTYPLKLNEMITINLMKSSHDTGSVKKMLHAPTLKLYSVKEVPLNSRDARNTLKEWIMNWQNTFENSKYHIKIHSTFWNAPEGCVSIAMEHINCGSLQNLLESVGNLPERAIRSICTNVLIGLDEIHNKLNSAHGVIAPSQILLDRQGNSKLNLGISHRINTSNILLHSFGKNTDRISLYDAMPVNNMTSWQKQLSNLKDPLSINSTDSKFLAQAQDIFDFGLMVLLCTVGGLEFFETQEFTDKLKLLLDELIKKPHERGKYCCIIHNEENITSMKLPQQSIGNITNDGIKLNNSLKNAKDQLKNKHITMHDYLIANKFSNDFMSFLCSCLKFDPMERANAKTLFTHPFIVNNQDSKNYSVSLQELLKISIQWTKSCILPPEYQGVSEKQLDRLIESLTVVLPNCDRPQGSDHSFRDSLLFENLNQHSSVIQDLAQDLGLPPLKVWKKIEGMIRNLNDQDITTIIAENKQTLGK